MKKTLSSSLKIARPLVKGGRLIIMRCEDAHLWQFWYPISDSGYSKPKFEVNKGIRVSDFGYCGKSPPPYRS